MAFVAVAALPVVWAEESTKSPAPPSRAVRPKAGPPAKLDDIRALARKRAASGKVKAPGSSPEKTAPAAPISPDTIGAEKLTPESVEDGLGAAYVRPTRGQRVNLNFTDVELPELVRAISVATGRRFIVSGKVRSIKASIFSPASVSPPEAYQAFLSVLAANGMTVVPSGRYLKIVDSGDAVAHPVPLCADGEACGGGDNMITRLHRLRYVSSDDMSQVLGRFKTSDGDITAYAPTNTLVITDYATNVRRMLRIVQELDVEGVGTQIWTEPIYYSSAAEIADLVSQLFQPEESGGGRAASKRSKSKRSSRRRRGKRAAKRDAATVGEARSGERLKLIIPDERTNQLIIVASERTYLQVLELIRALDTPLADGDGEIRVHKLQNADAEELASVLSSLSSKSSRPSSKRGKRSSAKAQSSGSLFEGDLQITADKATNSLIIVGSARDYMSLRKVISELDAERRQVFVEAVIMEVSVESNRRLGLAFHSGFPMEDLEYGDTTGTGIGLLGTSYESGQLNSLILTPNMLQGLALGIRGPEIEGSEDSNILPAGLSIPAFGVVLQALQSTSDVNVLSTPHILAMDNEEAEIQVGQNVPVSQAFAGGLGNLSSLAGMAGGAGASGMGAAASALGGGLFPNMSIQRQNVGIKLAITPHINQSDKVRLEIDLEVSEVTSESNLGPNIGQRTAKTTCVMADQQTVVIGGLVTDNVTNGVEKVPFLGDIPLLGRLFRRTTKTTTKRNLVIFLTPYIVRDAADFRRIFTRKMQERREFIDRYTAFEYHDVQPNIDYDRTNGMLEEINQTVIILDTEAEQRRLLEDVEIPEHVPRPPVGVVGPGDASDSEEGATPAGDMDDMGDDEASLIAPPPSVVRASSFNPRLVGRAVATDTSSDDDE
jgi:general secretion pathway protein D